MDIFGDKARYDASVVESRNREFWFFFLFLSRSSSSSSSSSSRVEGGFSMSRLFLKFQERSFFPPVPFICCLLLLLVLLLLLIHSSSSSSSSSFDIAFIRSSLSQLSKVLSKKEPGRDSSPGPPFHWGGIK